MDLIPFPASSTEHSHWERGTFPIPDGAESLLERSISRLNECLQELRAAEQRDRDAQWFANVERIVRKAQDEFRALMFHWTEANPLAEEVTPELKLREMYFAVSPRFMGFVGSRCMAVPMQLWLAMQDRNIEEISELVPRDESEEGTLSDWLSGRIQDLGELKSMIMVARDRQSPIRSNRFERDEEYSVFWIEGRELHPSPDQMLFIKFLDSIFPDEASWPTIDGRDRKFIADKPSKMFSEDTNTDGPELYKMIHRRGKGAGTRYRLKLRPTVRQCSA